MLFLKMVMNTWIPLLITIDQNLWGNLCKKGQQRNSERSKTLGVMLLQTVKELTLEAHSISVQLTSPYRKHHLIRSQQWSLFYNINHQENIIISTIMQIF